MSPCSYRYVALALALASCRAHADEPAWQRAAGALSSTAIRADVEYLTDDLFEGRRAGARGEALAARYLAARLEANGFPVERQRTLVPVTTLRSATLLATHGNVTVELRYGDDFVLLAAPREGAPLEAVDPPLERPSQGEWLRLGAARAAAALVPVGPLRVAIAPAAATQVGGARVVVRATLDLAEVAATTVTARARGSDPCEQTIEAHHDGFGAGFPGAADGAAGVALLLEVARGLARAGQTPRCSVVFRSSGAGEWATDAQGAHVAPPVAPDLAARTHTARDRISRDWDWEDLKRRAQAQLVGAAR